MKKLGQWTHRWFAAAYRSASRCESLISDLDDDRVGDLEIELMVYISCLNNFRRGACTALRGMDELAIELFDKAVPNLKQVRDQLEHFDEYAVGTGRLQTAEESEDGFWAVGHSGGRRNVSGRRSISARFQVSSSIYEQSPHTSEVDLVPSLLAALELMSAVLVTTKAGEPPTMIMIAAELWTKNQRL